MTKREFKVLTNKLNDIEDGLVKLRDDEERLSEQGKEKDAENNYDWSLKLEKKLQDILNEYF